MSQVGKSTEAKAEYGAGLALYQTLADNNPEISEYRFRLADNQLSLGRLFLAGWQAR